MAKDNPAVVQSDGTILVEVDNPAYEKARDSLMRFSDLVKSPEYIHTYRLSPLSLWNAAAVGLHPDEVIDSLTRFSRYPVPQNMVTYVRDTMAKFGLIRMTREGGDLVITCSDPMVFQEITHSDKVQRFIRKSLSNQSFTVDTIDRGPLKQVLIKMGYPCEDLAGYVEGDPLRFSLRTTTTQGKPLASGRTNRLPAMHSGQEARFAEAAELSPLRGAGKTIVGMGAMEKRLLGLLFSQPI